jgi:excinuclease ABC subunit A
MQRINLATSIGSSLVGTLYVLDEPSIGLHPRDTERMIAILRRLRNLGNTVIVVEHDEDIIRAADWVIDMGPRAGEHGGNVVFSGTVPQLLESKKSLTGKYISGSLQVHTNTVRYPGNGKFLTLIKPREHNLRLDKLQIPLGCCTVFTGVSGSGKSTLIHDVLYKNMLRLRGQSVSSVGKVEEIEGTENISHIEMIDQSPISTSSRSTPATYTGAFDFVRELFAGTPDAKRLNWRPGYFSFNVPGGRCDACEGEGQTRVEMQFMADIFLPCEVCNGTRFKAEAKEILYRGKNIMQVLDMTISEAIEFFAKEKRVINRLKPLDDVGLGYMRLGQPGHTLSGGEAQRIKLASHLAYSDHDQMLFIFDEPTTGLHFDDISKLLLAFRKLVERGHSLIIIEHNPDVILSADWIIDIGPEGGIGGGLVIAEGTPKQIAEVETSHTGAYLRSIFSRKY